MIAFETIKHFGKDVGEIFRRGPQEPDPGKAVLAGKGTNVQSLLRVLMQVLLTMTVIVASSFHLLGNGSEESIRLSYAALGVVMGYWLR